MALFGVPRLDDVLEDGRTARSVLLLSEPAVEAEPFLYQAARLRLQAGGEVVYVVTNRSPARVREALGAQGLRSREGEGLWFVDAFSALLGIHDGDTPTLEDPDDVAGLARMVARAAEEHPDATLVVDSLSGLALRAAESFREHADALLEAMRAFPHTVALYTQWGDDDASLPLLSSFEDQVRLTGVRQRITTSQYFRVRQLDGEPCGDGDAVLYRTDAGGVHVYIPKIVVMGPEDAGKTTFVHSVCDTAVSTERKGTTVALDRGQIRRGGMQVEVFGTPGQSRFSPLVAPMLKQAVGVVLMVDATLPGSLERAREMFEEVWHGGRCAVVVANKQDVEGALSPAEVAERLGLPQGVPVVGCRASDPASAESVLSILVERILRGPQGGLAA